MERFGVGKYQCVGIFESKSLFIRTLNVYFFHNYILISFNVFLLFLPYISLSLVIYNLFFTKNNIL